MAITETRQLPPKFIEELGTDLGTQLIAQSGRPTVAPGTGGITQLAGESADDFAARQQAAQAVINQQLNSSTKFTETKNSTTPGNTSIGTNKALPMNENVLSTNENILASGSQPNPFEFSNQ